MVTIMAGAAQLADAFRAATRITAICHENPDGDTLGAAIAVSLIAERLGKQSEVVSVDPPAPAFDYLSGFERITSRPRLEPDLAVVCDAASLERVGRIVEQEDAWFRRARLATIDHHVTNTGFGDVQLVDTQASATCEVVVRLADELGVTLDAPLATALLTGIVRDTQGFAEPSTSAGTLRLTARLTEAGAPLAWIQRRTFGDIPFAKMGLWGRLLAGMECSLGGRVVHTILTPQMLAETGTQQHDADGIAEFMATVRDTDIAILLRELGPSETRVSLRTRDGVDASRVAARFGGGGHLRRAGCSVAAPPRDSLAALLDVLRSELEA